MASRARTRACARRGGGGTPRGDMPPSGCLTPHRGACAARRARPAHAPSGRDATSPLHRPTRPMGAQARPGRGTRPRHVRAAARRRATHLGRACVDRPPARSHKACGRVHGAGMRPLGGRAAGVPRQRRRSAVRWPAGRLAKRSAGQAGWPAPPGHSRAGSRRATAGRRVKGWALYRPARARAPKAGLSPWRPRRRRARPSAGLLHARCVS